MARTENKIAAKQRGGKVQAGAAGLFSRLENSLEKNQKKIFIAFLFFSTLFSLLLFDSKVSPGGDDSSYIERAWQFLHEGNYPYFQGPGYPVALSMFVKLFGLNVIALKFFSVICQFGFVWFSYKAFHKRIPYTVLFALLAFISFNHFIQYYASQTFTETFFLFVQSVCFYFVFRIIDVASKNDTLKEVFLKNYRSWIGFALFFVLLSISKSVAVVAIGGVIIYFSARREFRYALAALVCFIALRLIYEAVVRSVYGPSGSDQFEMILRKDLYKPAEGHENFAGLITRFFDNFNTYISLHMYRVLNIRNGDTEQVKIIPALAYISAIFLGIATVVSYRKNKYVFFAAVYFIILCSGIFIGIQAANMQDRLIIIAMPMIFVVLFFAVYQLATRSSAAQNAVIIFASFMLLVTVFKSSAIAKNNLKALKKNLAGDEYYGYTPDWQNFLRMSRYCEDSLPDSAVVLSRKPTMSFIYAHGKKFQGQYWVTTTNPDSVLLEWGQKKIRYVILANIRMNPNKNNGQIINTIHRMLAPVYQKYPQKVHLVKTIGDVEKCDLFRLDY